VEMETCSQCQFSYGALPRRELVVALEVGGADVAARLSSNEDELRVRRTAEEWSPLEYGCHVRDVLLMQRDRIYVALVEDEPSFKPMYREQRVIFDRYSDQIPAEVADELVMATSLFANALAGLTDDQWERPLVYGFPGPRRRDVEWVGHHTLHEAVHHAYDIDQILSAS
jgi:hypothetical protein